MNEMIHFADVLKHSELPVPTQNKQLKSFKSTDTQTRVQNISYSSAINFQEVLGLNWDSVMNQSTELLCFCLCEGDA